MANRLKQILPQLISSTQRAFVPGRLITDNVLVAYETLHTMHCRKKGRKGALALKLDISKAYDRVEWAFLEKIMHKLGFPEVWIGRVMSCISTSSFSVRINGKAYGNIIPTRGLRQGILYRHTCFFFVQRGSQLYCQEQRRKGDCMEFHFVGELPELHTYYLLMTHYCFAKPIKMKFNSLLIQFICMQQHLGNVSILKNHLFILAAIWRRDKEKVSKLLWGYRRWKGLNHTWVYQL